MMAVWHKYASIAYGAAALLGVTLLLTDGYLAKLAGSAQNLIGLFLALGTATIGAACVVIARPIIGQYGAIRITAITMMMGSIGLWCVVGIFWNIWVNPLTLFDRAPNYAVSLITIDLYNTTITQFLGLLSAVDNSILFLG